MGASIFLDGGGTAKLEEEDKGGSGRGGETIQRREGGDTTVGLPLRNRLYAYVCTYVGEGGGKTIQRSGVPSNDFAQLPKFASDYIFVIVHCSM